MLRISLFLMCMVIPILSSAGGVGSAGDIDNLNGQAEHEKARVKLLKAQLEAVKLQNDIANERSTAGQIPVQSLNTDSAQQDLSMPIQQPVADKVPDITLTGLRYKDGKMVAIVHYNNMKIPVSVGDKLDDDTIVTKVTSSRVEINYHGHMMLVGMTDISSGSTSTDSSSSGSTGGLATP